jgi:hypothetical protein
MNSTYQPGWYRSQPFLCLLYWRYIQLIIIRASWSYRLYKNREIKILEQGHWTGKSPSCRYMKKLKVLQTQRIATFPVVKPYSCCVQILYHNMALYYSVHQILLYKNIVIIPNSNRLRFPQFFQLKSSIDIVLKKGRQCFPASVHTQNSCVNGVF